MGLCVMCCCCTVQMDHVFHLMHAGKADKGDVLASVETDLRTSQDAETTPVHSACSDVTSDFHLTSL